jgi:uncharacterized protein YbgA (DUF1722 family)/uncharacterized protein YbbK (DUF523 family)
MPAEIPDRPDAPLPVAVSSCLLGEPVRYDGTDKREALCHAELDGLLELRGVCPEMGIGMGAPRDPIRLVGEPSAPRAHGVDDAAIDVTDALQRFGDDIAARVTDICGHILMRNSPSCGLYTVKVYPQGGGEPSPVGRGIYSAALTRAMPDLPVEENERLDDPALRDSFLTRVFCYAHWRRLGASGLTAGRLIAFHAEYKYLLMAHSVRDYHEAGRLLGDLRTELGPTAGRYFHVLMAGLSRPATAGGHANALQHLVGYVSDRLATEQRRTLQDAIDRCRRGELPLSEPIVLLQEHIERHGSDYVKAQKYFEPYPGARLR